MGAFTNRGNLEARRSMWKLSPAGGGIRRGHCPQRMNAGAFMAGGKLILTRGTVQ